MGKDVMDSVGNGFDWTMRIVVKCMIMDCLAHTAVFLVGYFQCTFICRMKGCE